MHLMVVAASLAGFAVVAVGLVLRRTQYSAGPNRRGGGFNCCEFCGAALPLHPQHSWRYDSTCQRCGRVQTWARPAEPAEAPATRRAGPTASVAAPHAPAPETEPKSPAAPAPAEL